MALDSLHKTQQQPNTTLTIARNAAGSRGEEFNENREKEKRRWPTSKRQRIFTGFFIPSPSIFIECGFFVLTAYLSIAVMAKLKLFPKRSWFCLSSKVTFFLGGGNTNGNRHSN